MKKTPLNKKRSTKTKDNEYWRKKCVELAKRIVRHESNYKCEYCGLGEPDRMTHGSHIYSEGVNHGMSADLDNILCICSVHHMAAGPWNRGSKWSWHNSPAEAMEWFMEKYPERYEELKLRKQKPVKKDFAKYYEELKSKWASICH